MRTSIRNASVCALCEPKCLATSKCSAHYISLRSKQGTVFLAPPGGCPLKAKGVTSKVRLLLILPSYEHSPKPLFFCSFKACLAFCRRYPLCFLILFIYLSLAFLFSLLLSHHQLTKAHKVLGAKQHGITVSSSFEIQPVFLHSSSLFCHTLWLLKLKDPKELVLRAIQGRGAQYYWM